MPKFLLFPVYLSTIEKLFNQQFKEISEHSQKTFVVELVFSIVIGGWIGQLELLDCRPITLGQKTQFYKDFCKIFEILEHPFSSDDFKKIICSEIFSSVACFRQNSCNRKKTELQHIRFSGFFSKDFGAAISKKTFMKSSFTKFSIILGLEVCRLETSSVLYFSENVTPQEIIS